MSAQKTCLATKNGGGKCRQTNNLKDGFCKYHDSAKFRDIYKIEHPELFDQETQTIQDTQPSETITDLKDLLIDDLASQIVSIKSDIKSLKETNQMLIDGMKDLQSIIDEIKQQYPLE